MVLALITTGWVAADDTQPLDIGTRRELFADQYLIDTLRDVRLVLHTPRDEGIVVRFDQPWEGPFCGYCTVIQDGPTYRLYYRGLPAAGRDGSAAEVCCYAESADGLHWTKPDLGLFELAGTTHNNVVLANAAPVTHNFCPLLDTRPGVPAEQRFKALGGTMESGLVAHVSPDGIHWQRLVEPAGADQGDGAFSVHVRLAEPGVLVGVRIAVPLLLPRIPGRYPPHLSHDQPGLRALVDTGADGVSTARRRSAASSISTPTRRIRTFARRICTWRSRRVSCPVARCSPTRRPPRSV